MIMDEEYWEALRRMAPDYGYTTRNALIFAILKQVVDGLPQYLEVGAEDAKVRYVARELDKPWEPPLNPPPKDVMKEIFGNDFPE